MRSPVGLRSIASFSAAEISGVKLLGDSLRNLALDCEHVVQIAIVLFGARCPASVRVSTNCAFDVQFAARSSDRPLQHVGHTQRIADLAHIVFTAILHDAGAADHLQVGDFRQLGQDVVLDAIGKERVLFLVAQIFEWQNGDASCWRLPD